MGVWKGERMGDRFSERVLAFSRTRTLTLSYAHAASVTPCGDQACR